MTFFWHGPTGFLEDKAFDVSSWAAEMALKENDKPGRDHHTNTKTQRQKKSEAAFRNLKFSLHQYSRGKL